MVFDFAGLIDAPTGPDQPEPMTTDGRLGLELFADDCIQDPYPLYQRMLAAGPVHRVEPAGELAQVAARAAHPPRPAQRQVSLDRAADEAARAAGSTSAMRPILAAR